MCLNSIQLNMTKNSAGTYTGIGYKKLRESSFCKETGKFINDKYKKWSKKWTSCEISWFDRLFGFEPIPILTLDTDYNTEYDGGFHIFLNEKDARDYVGHDGKVVKVEFKDIICFGKNESYFDYENSVGILGDCVVARYMRVLEIVPEKIDEVSHV